MNIPGAILAQTLPALGPLLGDVSCGAAGLEYAVCGRSGAVEQQPGWSVSTVRTQALALTEYVSRTLQRRGCAAGAPVHCTLDFGAWASSNLATLCRSPFSWRLVQDGFGRVDVGGAGWLERCFTQQNRSVPLVLGGGCSRLWGPWGTLHCCSLHAPCVVGTRGVVHSTQAGALTHVVRTRVVSRRAWLPFANLFCAQWLHTFIC